MPRFKSFIYSPKIKLFLKTKMQNFQPLGATPPDSQNRSLNCEFLATCLPRFALLIIIWVFVAFGLNNFFLDRSVANLMMLTIDVCLMLNCFLFEKFYLQYALCDFDSILLHYAMLFIRQSIDREQAFDAIFEPPPPIEKSCVRY